MVQLSQEGACLFVWSMMEHTSEQPPPPPACFLSFARTHTAKRAVQKSFGFAASAVSASLQGSRSLAAYSLPTLSSVRTCVRFALECVAFWYGGSRKSKRARHTPRLGRNVFPAVFSARLHPKFPGRAVDNANVPQIVCVCVCVDKRCAKHSCELERF